MGGKGRQGRQAPGNVLSGTPASSLQLPGARFGGRGGEGGEGGKKRREPWVWSARRAASSRFGNERKRARAVLLVFVPPPRLPCLCCKRSLGAGWTPAYFCSGEWEGVSRDPNADSGITSGGRQGVKGDPRGPFTSASCASPCPGSPPGPSTLGRGFFSVRVLLAGKSRAASSTTWFREDA